MGVMKQRRGSRYDELSCAVAVANGGAMVAVYTTKEYDFPRLWGQEA